jgi:hypothetical protein
MFFKKNPKIKTDLQDDPDVPLLGIHEMKSFYQRDTFGSKFTEALFTIVKIETQPRCLSTDTWRKKIWCKHLNII